MTSRVVGSITDVLNVELAPNTDGHLTPCPLLDYSSPIISGFPL